MKAYDRRYDVAMKAASAVKAVSLALGHTVTEGVVMGDGDSKVHLDANGPWTYKAISQWYAAFLRSIVKEISDKQHVPLELEFRYNRPLKRPAKAKAKARR